MKEKFERLALIWIIALLTLSMMNFQVLSHDYPTRYYAGTGGLSSATFWVTPEDNNFTSTKPGDNRTGTKFTINVRVNATEVAGWQVELSYNKYHLSTSIADVGYAADMLFPPGSYPTMPPSIEAFNATHNYILMTASTYGAVNYTANNKGLMTVNFTILADPDPSGVLWCWLRLMLTSDPPPNTGMMGTYALDSTGSTLESPIYLRDGYYENRYVPVAPAHLELSPTLVRRPAIEGDKVVNTSKGIFSFDILIKGTSSADELFFVQLALIYNSTLIRGVWIEEGTFMNDTAWAPHGTMDNFTIVEEGKMTWWGMIMPNSTGYWDNDELGLTWPSGNGLLAKARLELAWQGLDSNGVAPEELLATSDIKLVGVFDEFFLGHPNKYPEPDYLPYSSPINATVNIYGYYWKPPVADFTWTPEEPTAAVPATFDASASYGYRNINGVPTQDPTYIKEYRWDWGDGNTNTTANPIITHNYTEPGDYNVTLRITDYDEKTNSTSDLVLVFETVNHTITVDTHTFTVTTRSTGKIKPNSAILIQTHRCLHFNVTGKSGGLGILNITIPKALLDALPEDWLVILQGDIITTEEGLIVADVDTEWTMLSMAFTFGSDERVFVLGTFVIPEFPVNGFALAFMVMLIVSAMSIAFSKKLRK